MTTSRKYRNPWALSGVLFAAFFIASPARDIPEIPMQAPLSEEE